MHPSDTLASTTYARMVIVAMRNFRRRQEATQPVARKDGSVSGIAQECARDGATGGVRGAVEDSPRERPPAAALRQA